jgi:hypothetical protein
MKKLLSSLRWVEGMYFDAGHHSTGQMSSKLEERMSERSRDINSEFFKPASNNVKSRLPDILRYAGCCIEFLMIGKHGHKIICSL